MPHGKQSLFPQKEPVLRANPAWPTQPTNGGCRSSVGPNETVLLLSMEFRNKTAAS